jgi:antitoxin VapB
MIACKSLILRSPKSISDRLLALVLSHGMVESMVDRKKVPSLNIKDPEVHALAMELARRTSRSMTEVVRDSLRKSLERERTRHTDRSRVGNRVMEIAARITSRPVLDHRTPEEILAYDENGLPV